MYKNENGDTISDFKLSIQDIYKSIPITIRRTIDFSFIDNDVIDYINGYIKQHTEIYEKLSLQQEQGQFMSLLGEIKTVFVPAQRLYYTNTGAIEDSSYTYRNRSIERKKLSSIDKMIFDFKKELQKRRLNYLLETQKHDNQFINKLISSSSEVYDKKTYTEKLMNLNKRIKELYSFGLIGNISTIAYDESKKNILSVYIDDLAEKLDSYNDLIGKLRIFSEIIKEKEFSNKKITFSPDEGIFITTTNGDTINPNALSSGEQNELIMLYRFIFEANESSVLLIDEPEISLHIAWQMDFLDDIESILKEKNMQVIIATHSPQIINGRWDNCFDFYKNNDE